MRPLRQIRFPKSTPIRRAARQAWQKLLRIREAACLTEEGFHLLLACGIGFLGGFVKLLFQSGGDALQMTLFANSGSLVHLAKQFEWWQRLLTPALGGLIAGLILYWGLKRVKKPGPGNLLEAVAAGDGRLRFKPALVKSLSSIFSINTGASIGQEGAISQLTATLASKWGQGFQWPPYRLRLMVACGAAAGIAAAYNAPIAGAVFAAHIVLGNFAMTLFAPLLIASVTATMVSRSLFGMKPWYQAPVFEFTSIVELPWFFALGILCGLGGAFFMKALRVAEKWFGNLPVPPPWRLAIGGLAVGAFAIVLPEAWGNGYVGANEILHDSLTLRFLSILVLIKFFSILSAVGSGAVGGVFTPTLFLGAGIGGILGMLLHQADWAMDLPVAIFGLVGMGGILAATTHSPLLAMILVFEISMNYSLMPPLMIACAVATLVGKRFARESIYQEPLARKGMRSGQEASKIGATDQFTVGDLMHEPIPPIRETTTLREIGDRFLKASYNFLPVIEENGRLIGQVALQDLKEHLTNYEDYRLIIAYDLMRPPLEVLVPGDNLLNALPLLLRTELRNIPVVNSHHERKLIGRISRTEALGMLTEAITERELGNI